MVYLMISKPILNHVTVYDLQKKVVYNPSQQKTMQATEEVQTWRFLKKHTIECQGYRFMWSNCGLNNINRYWNVSYNNVNTYPDRDQDF